MSRMLGVIILVMAFITAIVPQFTNCEHLSRTITLANGSTVPMKCYWTAQAELGTSIPLLAIGALMTVNRHKESRRNLSILGVALGIVVLLLPTALIGVCQTLMPCHTIMKPVLLTTGGS